MTLKNLFSRPLPIALASLVVGAFLGAMVTSGANANTAVTSKAEVEAIVRDYIANHGEELAASIQAAGTREQRAAMQNVITDDTPTMGPKDAPVTLIEFSDYECPFCARVQGSLAELRQQYGNKIRWVFKNLPLSFHENAEPAALAAMAAHKQGKFWEYNDALWQNQASLNDTTYLKIARDLGLNIDRFNKDRASDALKQKVAADLSDAEATGARGTPHFIINGTALSGAMPTGEFRKIIDAQLKAAGK